MDYTLTPKVKKLRFDDKQRYVKDKKIQNMES